MEALNERCRSISNVLQAARANQQQPNCMKRSVFSNYKDIKRSVTVRVYIPYVT